MREDNLDMGAWAIGGFQVSIFNALTRPESKRLEPRAGSGAYLRY